MDTQEKIKAAKKADRVFNKIKNVCIDLSIDDGPEVQEKFIVALRTAIDGNNNFYATEAIRTFSDSIKGL